MHLSHALFEEESEQSKRFITTEESEQSKKRHGNQRIITNTLYDNATRIIIPILLITRKVSLIIWIVFT